MNFKEAVATGGKVRSENWRPNDTMDTSLFSEKMDDNIKKMFCGISVPLKWVDILGNWELVEEVK